MVHLYSSPLHLFFNKQRLVAFLVLISLFFCAVAYGQEAEAPGEAIETEVLDWFADNVGDLIPKSATFVIKDVQTGMTFTAIRCSGTNHLDAEPVTAEDTAAFKKLLGGKWRWRGRPALLLYNGRVFAASLCGMPHGTKTVKGNGFKGHFCIHFKSSKLHARDEVIKAYQNAVAIAGEATWHDNGP